MQKLTDFFRKHQKLIFIFALLVSVFSVVFALSFATDFVALGKVATEERDGVPSAIAPYNTVQAFNKTVFYLSLVYLLIAAVLFIYFGHKRRIYYKTNIVSISLYVLFSVFFSAFVLVNIASVSNALDTVDYAAVKQQLENAKIGSMYTESRFWLHVGIVLSVIAFISAVVMCINMMLRLRTISIEKTLKRTVAEDSNINDNNAQGSALKSTVDNIDKLSDVSNAVAQKSEVEKEEGSNV